MIKQFCKELFRKCVPQNSFQNTSNITHMQDINNVNTKCTTVRCTLAFVQVELHVLMKYSVLYFTEA